MSFKTDTDQRREEILVCGGRAVSALLATGKVGKLYVDSGNVRAVTLGERATDVVVEETTKQRLNRLVGDEQHHGVVAVVNPPTATLMDVLPQKDKPLVLLDGVTDPRNLGAVMRVAHAFAAVAVVAPHRRCAPLSAVAVRASAGAAAHLPLIRVTNVRRTLQQIQDAGWTTVAAAEEGDSTWSAAVLPSPICWVLGDEGKGIRRLTREYCDFLWRIPTVTGEAGCLNVVTACAVFLATEKMRKTVTT